MIMPRLTTSLTVNSAAPWRKGEYFRKEVSVANSAVAVWQAIAVAATGETTVNGNVFVPQTPENFTYDDDGTLTQDGRWDYTWDAENRLVKLVSKSGAPSGSEKSVDFSYDGKSRRISKTVSNWVSGAWQLESTNRFVYDGWNLIAVLSSGSTLQSAFMWGLDLSGTLQGAGGVGGLLMFTNSGNGAHFCAYDGNGNLAALVKASDGTVSANYEYGPFGEALRVTGAMGKANPFRFSSKYQDDESDFLYYGYRYYNPSTGRWLSRDPIEELGGMNLCGILGNNPINQIDALGLASLDQLLHIMEKLHKALARSLRCSCPDEAAYLQCVLGELNNIFAKTGLDQATQQALAQAKSWKVTVKNATGLDKDTANALEKALDTLAKYSGPYTWDGSGGIADKLNCKRKCFNKTVGLVTDTASTAAELYNGDAVVAALVFFEKASTAAVPLEPLKQWISFYKDAYVNATRTLDQIGLNGLENALGEIESFDLKDCEDISGSLGKGGAAPGGIRNKCKAKLNAGVGL